MHNRLRLLMGATALLYVGPLLAGLGGFGWATVPVFTLIFVLWLFILRPHEWPRSLADWQRPEALVALAARGAVQLLLVVVCFGVGRGIGGVLGALPPFPLALPLGISFLAIPLGRLVWDPWKAAGVDQFLDDAIRAVETPGPVSGPSEAAFAAVDPLFSLPANTPDVVVQAEIDRILSPIGLTERRLEALVSGLDIGAQRPLRRGLILWATTPEVAERHAGQALLRMAFPVMAYDAPEDAALFVARAMPLIAAHPGLWADFPRYQDLSYLIDFHADPTLKQDAMALARAVKQATPPEFRRDG